MNAEKYEINKKLIEVDDTLSRWGLRKEDWLLVDLYSFIIEGLSISDKSIWRNDITIYVKESCLPWKTFEKEQTIPPLDSKEMKQLLELHKKGIVLHIVPGERYLNSGIHHIKYDLLNRKEIRVASLRGSLCLWILRGLEFVSQIEEIGPDVDRIVHERMIRLKQLQSVSKDNNLVKLCIALSEGYEALLHGETEKAEFLFYNLNASRKKL